MSDVRKRTLQSKPLVPIPAINRAQVANVLEAMDDKWATNAYGFQQRIAEAIEAGDYNAANRWTWCAGVTTDKLLVLRGRPTAIVANLHAHRHEMSDVLSKVSEAVRVAELHARRGYSSVTRVTHSAASDPSPLALESRKVDQ